MASEYPAYAEYKKTHLGWLSQIPSHWEVKRLKYLGDALIGLTYSPDEIVDEGLGTLVLRSSNVQSKQLAFYDNVYVNKKIPEKLVTQKGDILICSRNGSRALIGKNAQIDESAAGMSFGAFMSIFRSPYNEYLSKVFNSPLFEYQSGSFLTATINQLTTGNLNSFEIPLPKESERKKIANFLDHETAKIDTMIEKQQQLIKLLKEKRQAVISHAVTKGLNPNAPMRDSGVEWLGEVPEHWDVCRLKQIIESGSSISYGIVQPGDPLDEGVSFVQTTNMSKGTFDLEGLQKTTAEIAKSYPRSTLIGGEVILGIRASIGAAYVVPESLRGCNLSRGVARIIPSEHIQAGYLVSYFGTGAVGRYWDIRKQGSTFSEVSIETVKELFLPVPPIEEQKQIYDWIDVHVARLDEVFQKAMEQTSLLQERRTVLISAAVTGKIDVRNWRAA